MKKLLSVALTLAITFTMSLAITASGQEDLSKHKRTPLGIAKFEEYLATLPPEQAANILSDPELVYNMQMEYYWDENPVIYSTPRASLPLSNYPSGSYYSFNSKGCTCHKKTAVSLSQPKLPENVFFIKVQILSNVKALPTMYIKNTTAMMSAANMQSPAAPAPSPTMPTALQNGRIFLKN